MMCPFLALPTNSWFVDLQTVETGLRFPDVDRIGQLLAGHEGQQDDCDPGDNTDRDPRCVFSCPSEFRFSDSVGYFTLTFQSFVALSNPRGFRYSLLSTRLLGCICH